MNSINLTDAQLRYREYLQSDHWRWLRLEAFRKWGRKCFKCPMKFGLDVHHLAYRYPWTLCTVEDVRPCCRGCHEKEHGIVTVIPQSVKIEIQLLSKRAQRKNRKYLKRQRKYMRRKARQEQLKRQFGNPTHYTKPWSRKPRFVNRGNSSN